MRDANGKNRNSFSTASGKNERGIVAPDRKPTMQFFIIFAPQRYLIINAIKPKQMLKKKFIRYAKTQLTI